MRKIGSITFFADMFGCALVKEENSSASFTEANIYFADDQMPRQTHVTIKPISINREGAEFEIINGGDELPKVLSVKLDNSMHHFPVWVPYEKKFLRKEPIGHGE